MSESIKQELGFDASKAIAELARLDKVMQNAAEGASVFQKKVAEIQTIGGGVNTANLVREFSDISGFSLADVARSQYQALSNQIGDAAQNTEFLTAAANLARGHLRGLPSFNACSGA